MIPFFFGAKFDRGLGDQNETGHGDEPGRNIKVSGWVLPAHPTWILSGMIYSMRMGRMHLGSLDTQPMDPAPCYIAEDQDDSTSSSSSCNNNDDDGYLTRSSSDHTDSDEMDEYHQLYTDDEDDDDDGDNAFFRQNRSRRRR